MMSFAMKNIIGCSKKQNLLFSWQKKKNIRVFSCHKIYFKVIFICSTVNQRQMKIFLVENYLIENIINV